MPPDPSIRNGTPEDDGDVARLVYGHPSPEASGLAGGAERATQLGLALFRAGIGRTPDDEIYLATLGGRPVGVLLGRGGESRSPISLRAGAALFRSALRLYAPWEIPGLLRRLHLRSRLDFPIPPGSFHVVELHVDPRHRGRSIGTALLRHAERRAGELGYHRLDLTTATANPARRLYERLGFEPLGERTVRGYERITGSRGRVFLGKALGGDGSRAPG
ncbi:MAG: GNAT family N-acetyltransferase [Deltaproteobacteria bacterium]|nr:GNAT family N-acetyltransferase [Deltaproteobacteria bacterium]